MGALLGKHELSFIPAPTQVSFTGVATRTTLMSDPTGVGPSHFTLRPSEDVRLLQGGSAVTASDTTSWLLKKNVYYRITVTSALNAYLSSITPSGGTNGTLEIIESSDASP